MNGIRMSLGAIILLAIVALIFLDPGITVHKKPKNFIQGMAFILESRPEKVMINVLDKDGGTYEIVHVLVGPTYISLKGYGVNSEKFHAVCKELVEIFQTAGIKLKAEAVEEVILVPGYQEHYQRMKMDYGKNSKRLLKVIKKYPKYFTILRIYYTVISALTPPTVPDSLRAGTSFYNILLL